MSDTKKYKPSTFNDSLLFAVANKTGGETEVGVPHKELVAPICTIHSITVEEFGIQESSGQPWLVRWLLSTFKGLRKKGLLAPGEKKGRWTITKAGLERVEEIREQFKDIDLGTTDDPSPEEPTKPSPKAKAEPKAKPKAEKPEVPLGDSLAEMIAENLEAAGAPVESTTFETPESPEEPDLAPKEVRDAWKATATAVYRCAECACEILEGELFGGTKDGVETDLCKPCFVKQAAPNNTDDVGDEDDNDIGPKPLADVQKKELLEHLDAIGEAAGFDPRPDIEAVFPELLENANDTDTKLQRLTEKAEQSKKANGNGNGEAKTPKAVDPSNTKKKAKHKTFEGQLLGVGIDGDKITVSWRPR